MCGRICEYFATFWNRLCSILTRRLEMPQLYEGGGGGSEEGTTLGASPFVFEEYVGSWFRVCVMVDTCRFGTVVSSKQVNGTRYVAMLVRDIGI